MLKPEAGAELPPLATELTQEKINRYARVSGDFNPIHIDPGYAAQTPLGGTVAHGMLLLAYLSEMLTAAFGERWLLGGRLKVRFRAPARPGDRIVAQGRVEKVGEGRVICSLQCRNQREVVVSGQAEVTL